MLGPAPPERNDRASARRDRASGKTSFSTLIPPLPAVRWGAPESASSHASLKGHTPERERLRVGTDDGPAVVRDEERAGELQVHGQLETAR
jgi:hypothetical protein